MVLRWAIFAPSFGPTLRSAELEPSYYVEKARLAILTDQPNLAMLYMQRGIETLEQRRRQHLRGSIEGRFTLLGEDVNKMADVFVQAFQPVLSSAAKAFDSFHSELLKSYDQEFYALVSE